MWRHPSEAIGHFSGAGPSPSQIAGILGAALGKRSIPEKDNPRPVSKELIDWLQKNNVQVVCRTLVTTRRIGTSVNGLKAVNSFETFRMQRKSLDLPSYEILVKINASAGEDLLQALKRPKYPIYLGDSNHLGKITRVTSPETILAGNWAYISNELIQEEYVWNTKFSTEEGTRLKREGFWNFPAPESQPKEASFETCTA